MVTGGCPWRPQGGIAGGARIPANAAYGYAPMGSVYDGVAIAGSSAGGLQGLRPPQPPSWTASEDNILKAGLERYRMDPILDACAKIAAVLPEKTIRDVVVRCRWWIARKESRKRAKDGRHIPEINGDNKERITYPSNSHPSTMPNMSGIGNDMDRDIVDLRRQLFHRNEEIFKKVYENLSSVLANENVGLLKLAFMNFTDITRINSITEAAVKMPSLPLELDTKLVLPTVNPSYGAPLL